MWEKKIKVLYDCVGIGMRVEWVITFVYYEILKKKSDHVHLNSN